MKKQIFMIFVIGVTGLVFNPNAFANEWAECFSENSTVLIQEYNQLLKQNKDQRQLLIDSRNSINSQDTDSKIRDLLRESVHIGNTYLEKDAEIRKQCSR